MAGRHALLSILLFSALYQVRCTESSSSRQLSNSWTASSSDTSSLTASASYTVDHQTSRDGRVQQQQAHGSVHAVEYRPSSADSATFSTSRVSSNEPRSHDTSFQSSKRSPTISYPMRASYQPQAIRQPSHLRPRIVVRPAPRPMMTKRPIHTSFMVNRRQYFEHNLKPYLTVPRPPPPPAMSKATIISRPSPGQVIYSKPPPEVIYYGPNPPPLDYSPPTSVTYRRPSRPVASSPVSYSAPQVPEDHDIMNDLDMYIPDDDPPSKTESSYSPMSSMMMPLMMLGLSLPAVGLAMTYFSRRRRRRRDVGHYQQEEMDRVLKLLNDYIEKAKKD